MPDGAPAAWRNVITSEVSAGGRALPVGDILLSFPVALLMGEGKEEYVQNPSVGPGLRRTILQNIGETDHVDPEGDDEGAAGLSVARERPGAGEHH